MSVGAQNYVLRFSPYTGVRYAVHLAIADSVNDEHHREFWMAVGKLARKARVTRSAASKALAELEGAGFLDCIERNRNTPSRYRFLQPPAPMVYDPDQRGGVPAGVSTEHTAQVGVSTEHSAVSSGDTVGVSTDRTNPIEPKPEPNETLAATSSPRRRDEVWEVLCEIEDVDWRCLNSGERGKIARARKMAGESSATPEQIRWAAANWSRVMTGATMTAIGVMQNFQKLLNGRAPPQRPRTEAEKFHAMMQEAVANGLDESGEPGGADVGVLPRPLGDGGEHHDLGGGTSAAR